MRPRACGLVGISRSLLAYRSRRQEPEGPRLRIGEVALAKRRYGYRRVHVLLRREGWEINHKRTHRIEFVLIPGEAGHRHRWHGHLRVRQHHHGRGVRQGAAHDL